MRQTLDILHEISRNIHARVNERMAENPQGTSAKADETHWLIVLQEELDLIEEEAKESNRLAPGSNEAGYDQGWGDAIRMIVDAMHSFDQARVRGVWAHNHKVPDL